MRIATWNVNGIRARLDFIRIWLRDRRPDIVGLQELKVTGDQFPHAEIEEEGYRAVVHGQKGWNGVAILHRSGAVVTQSGLPGQEPMGARLLSAAVEGISFTTIYCPNGKHVGHDDFDRKIEWLDALAAHLREIRPPVETAILCGDFNNCPEPIDSWNEEGLKGHIFHTAPERERFRNLLGLGLLDLFRQIHPGEQAFSWWDYRGGAFHRRQGLRIDLLLATRAAAAGATRAEIDREWRKKKEGRTPSDHAPVFAEL